MAPAGLTAPPPCASTAGGTSPSPPTAVAVPTSAPRTIRGAHVGGAWTRTPRRPRPAPRPPSAALGQVAASRRRGGDRHARRDQVGLDRVVESQACRGERGHRAGCRIVVRARGREGDRDGAAREQRGRGGRALISGEHDDRQLHAIVEAESARGRAAVAIEHERDRSRRAGGFGALRDRRAVARQQDGFAVDEARPSLARKSPSSVPATTSAGARAVSDLVGPAGSTSGIDVSLLGDRAPSSGALSTPFWMPSVPSATSTVGSDVRPSLAPTGSQPGEAAGEAIVPKRPPSRRRCRPRPRALRRPARRPRGDRLGRRPEWRRALPAGPRSRSGGRTGRLPVRVERAVEARKQRRGRAHERALLHLEHLDGHERCPRGAAVNPVGPPRPLDDSGHRRRMRRRQRVGIRRLRLAGDRVQPGAGSCR